MNRAIFFTSFFSMKFSGSKSFTWAAIWQAKLLASNRVILPTPLLPASKAFHASAAEFPTSQIMPRPVTTTRRPKLFPCLGVLADVVDGILHGADLFRVFVRTLDIEGFFEGHDQFDRVQR